MSQQNPNAADRSQVKHASRKEREEVQRELDNTRAVMGTPQGRALMWSILERFGVFRSVWHNSALIHYNAGRQDAGHEIMALLVEADEQLYMMMEREARDRARRDKVEREAVRTRRAEQGGQQA